MVHVVQRLEPGGLERLVLDLVGAADRRAVAPSIACTDDLGSLAAEVPEGVPISAMGARPGLDWRAARRLARHLRERGAEVVHSHNERAHVFATVAALLARVPISINTQHNLLPRRSRAGLISRRLTAALAEAIVAVSGPVAEAALAIDRAPAARVKTIRNGTTLDRKRYGREEARGLLGIPEGAFAAGALGRLSQEKDHRTLVEAVALARKNGTDLDLTIIGDGPLAAELGSLIKERGLEGAARLAGYRPDGPAFLPAFDVFVQPSRTEGIALAVLEAMAARIAIVASDVGGNPETLGEAGILVPAANPEALASALAALAVAPDRRLALGRAARARAEERFSIGAMARAYEGLYLDLARAKGLRA